MADYLKSGNRFEVFGQEFIALDTSVPGEALCITAEPWKTARFDDDIDRYCTNNINKASIKRCLSYVFLGSLVEADIGSFIMMDTDIYDNFGCHAYDYHHSLVRLLTLTEFLKYRDFLNMPNFSLTMTPYRCRTGEKDKDGKEIRQYGDQHVVSVDTRGRVGNFRASHMADVYPVVTLSQRICSHISFVKRRPI